MIGKRMYDGESCTFIYSADTPIDGRGNISKNYCGMEVIPETVSQYIGLKDREDRKIFGGDIITWATEDELANGPWLFEVVYDSDNASFILRDAYGTIDLFHDGNAKKCIIVANIWDYPELMKGE